MDYDNINIPKSEKNNNQPVKDKVIAPVAKGNIKKERKVDKICQLFFDCDAKEAKKRFIKDVLVPCTKDAILDIISSAFGNNNFSRHLRTGMKNMTDYGVYSNGRYNNNSRRSSVSSANSVVASDVVGITFSTRNECNTIIDRMCDIIETYGSTSIRDYYELSGNQDIITPSDSDFGWTSIASARVCRDSSGKFYIQLPNAIQL